MSWTCPDCQRTFRFTDQWHSCAKRSVLEHFQNKEAMRPLFDAVSSWVQSLGPVTVRPLKTSIQFRTTANFLSISVKKTHLTLSFQLDREEVEFPVYKTQRLSTRRFSHWVAIEHPDELDEQLKGWIRESFELIGAAGK